MQSNRFTAAGLSIIALLAFAGSVHAASLKGSRGSMDRQNRAAREHDFTFIRNPTQVSYFVSKGWLVPMPRRATNFQLAGVSFPYTRPEVKLFIERLSAQYRAACGERLVVTSLTRPRSHQPWNSSPRSVHPTGMALDLRRSNSRACRSWLEEALLSLESRGVLEATRERWPPHYHLAVFPEPYKRYVQALENGTMRTAQTHRVASGESLWTIARRYGTSVGRIKASNGLRGNVIRPGQRLKIPSSG